MIKKLILAKTALLLTQAAFGQKAATLNDTLFTYLNEVKTAANKQRQLWNKSLYGSVLFVNPGTRQAFAIHPDSAGILQPSGKVYTGLLPDHINVANTVVRWSGVDWAMIMLPLPKDKKDRIQLIAHELFHRVQPDLGFKLFNTSNDHLDKKEGRIFLRLELEALKRAVQSAEATESKEHLLHALTFRKYRHKLYPGADSTENLLELNEGLAEYTGFIVSNRNKEEAAAHFIKSIDDFLKNPTFVRSFAYQTIPIYGYLLRATKNDWNRRVTVETNLIDYFIDAFKIALPADLKKSAEGTIAQYNGEAIVKEETERDEQKKQVVARYKRELLEQPYFEIQFEKMNVSFDPQNIVPLEDKGTVYPKIRVTDNWGVLEVEKQALMSPDWRKIHVTVPTSIEGQLITGDGWYLKLHENYTVVKDNSGNYRLSKR